MSKELFARSRYEKRSVLKEVALQALKEVANKTYRLSSDELVIDCPICKKQKHLYISMSGTKGLFICFHCNVTGKLDKDVPLPAPTYEEKRVFIPDFHFLINGEKPGFFVSEAIEYLLGRGLTKDQIFKLRTFVRRGEKRVFFPSFVDNQMSFAVGRSFDSASTVKYYDIGCKKLYLTKKVEEYDKDFIVLCEGIFDAIALNEGVSLLGKYLSSYQEIALIDMFKNKEKIVICLDNDVYEKTILLYSRLFLYFDNVVAIQLPSTMKDPWDGRDKINRMIQSVITKHNNGVFEFSDDCEEYHQCPIV